MGKHLGLKREKPVVLVGRRRMEDSVNIYTLRPSQNHSPQTYLGQEVDVRSRFVTGTASSSASSGLLQSFYFCLHVSFKRPLSL